MSRPRPHGSLRARTTLLTLALVLPGCGESPTGGEDIEELVEPVLAFSGSNPRSSPGGGFVDYVLEVTNRSSYAASLFAPRSDVPSCGLNDGSRTWVEIYDGSGERLYGYCAFDHPVRLASFSFPVPAEADQPSGAYIELWDRVLDVRVRSNVVDLR